MSVIEKLDGVLANWRRDDMDNAHSPDPWDQGFVYGRSECADEIDALMPAIRQAMIDAERYRLVRAMCCSAEGPSAGLASAWMIGDEKAADAVIDARLASDSEGGE